MTAYVIAEVDVTDPETYKAYGALVPATVKRHGGRFVVRGGPTVTLEGATPKRIIVLEFDSAEAARRWYDSDDYAEPKSMRLRATKSRIFIVDGAAP